MEEFNDLVADQDLHFWMQKRKHLQDLIFLKVFVEICLIGESFDEIVETEIKKWKPFLLVAVAFKEIKSKEKENKIFSKHLNRC